jgi:exodeoxyribonuclease VII small subunit
VTHAGHAGHAGHAEGADDRPGYEAARAELVEVVARLEAGGATLEESLGLWERGEELAAICQQHLDGARARLAAAVEGLPTGDDSGADSATPTG